MKRRRRAYRPEVVSFVLDLVLKCCSSFIRPAKPASETTPEPDDPRANPTQDRQQPNDHGYG